MEPLQNVGDFYLGAGDASLRKSFLLMENARIVLEFICGLFLLDILLDILYLLYLLRALCFLKNLSL